MQLSFYGILGDVRSEAMEHSIVGELGITRKCGFYEQYRLEALTAAVKKMLERFI